MIYIKTKSGRFISLNHIVGFAIDEQVIELEGKRKRVFNVIAYLPEHLYHAILAIYSDFDQAQKDLERFMERILTLDKGIVSLDAEKRPRL